MTVPILAAGAAGAARRRVLDAFREAGATSPKHAQSIRDLAPPEQNQIRALLSAGIIRESEPGRYYLDEPALARYDAAHQRVLIRAASVFLAVAAFAVLVYFALGGR